MSTFPRSIWWSIAIVGLMLGLERVVPDGLSGDPSSSVPPTFGVAPGATTGTAGITAVDFVSAATIELTQFDDTQAIEHVCVSFVPASAAVA